MIIIMVKLIMIKDMRIYDLIKIAKKNNFSPTQMAGKLGISYVQYNRWKKGISTPINKNTLNIIDRVISKYK